MAYATHDWSIPSWPTDDGVVRRNVFKSFPTFTTGHSLSIKLYLFVTCVVSIVCCIHHVCRNSVFDSCHIPHLTWNTESRKVVFLCTTSGSDFCKQGNVSHHTKLKATQEKGAPLISYTRRQEERLLVSANLRSSICWCPCGLAALDVAGLLLGGQEDLICWTAFHSIDAVSSTFGRKILTSYFCSSCFEMKIQTLRYEVLR